MYQQRVSQGEVLSKSESTSAPPELNRKPMIF